jgi:hypothetical protein
MTGDLFERLFPDPGQGETVLMLLVLAVVAIGLWFGRKRLRLAIPLAVAVVLLAAMAIPGCIPAHTYAHRAACINNLRLIENAKAKWAAANGKRLNDTPSEEDLFGPDLNGRPVCPSGGVYSLGTVGEKPKCSLDLKGHRLE